MTDVIKRISLGTWVVGAGAFILFGAWVIVLFVIQQERDIEIVRAERHASSLASVLERHVTSTLGQLESSLYSLRSNWESNQDVSKMNVLLQHHVSSKSDLYNLISIIDASGHVVVTNQYPATSTYSGDRPFFLHHQRVKDNAMLIGGPILGRVTGKWYLPVSIRLEDSQGRFNGVILASVNPYYFSGIFRELHLGLDSLVYLAGRDGTIYSGMGESGELSLDAFVPQSLAASFFYEANNFLGIEKSILDGVERILCRKFVPGRDLFVSMGFSLSESLSQWRMRTTVLLALLFLLSISYVFLLARLRQTIASRETATMELDRFFTSVLDLLCITDIQGRFRRLNAQWESSLGYTVQELEGQSFLDFVHPDDLSATIEALEVLESQKSVQSFINRYRSKNGSYRYIEWRSSLQGELIYAAARDITDRKAVETALRQSNETLSLFIKYSPIYAYIKDVAPTESRVLFASDNFENMIGIKSADMIGRTMFELFPVDMARSMIEDDWKVVSNGQVLRIEEDFNSRHYSSIKFPIPQGNRTLMAGYTIDVTDVISNQEALRVAKDAAEAANRVKSEFLANMSHEIRTPLNGMVATLELLKSTMLDGEQEGLAETAIGSCNRLARLLSDILDLSRIEAGKLRIQSEPMSLKDVFAQTKGLFAPIANKKGVDLHFQVDPAIPDKILGDGARLQQVLANMVGNALKFTDDGKISVNATNLPTRQNNRCLILFSVADTGIGIADDSLPDLFKAFTQVSEGYTRSQQGAGLGLSICKRLVEFMGGSICVMSEPNVGTSFWFSLPFDLVDSIALPDSTDTEVGTLGPSLAGLSILLVEDDLVSAYAAVRLMEKRGIQVVHVVNGAQALEVLRSREFDLVLMDVQMPVMDGVAATRAIRNNEAGEAARSLPIIALTAYAMDDDKTIFLDAGMNDYLPKPVRLENLEAGIGRWLCDTKKRVDQ